MSLLDRSKSLIDTVEPVGWIWCRNYSGGGYSTELCNTKQQAEALLERFTEGGTVDSVRPLYSRETVERLLEAHRKQVLLEAEKAVMATYTNPSADEYGTLCDARNELRRMVSEPIGEKIKRDE